MRSHRNLLALVVLSFGCGQTQQPTLPVNPPADASTAQTLAPVTATNRVLTPEEALELLGQTRTVEFRVASGSVVFHSEPEGRQRWVYLSDVATEKRLRPTYQLTVG